MSAPFGPWQVVPQKILGPRRLSICRPDRSKGLLPPTWLAGRERPPSCGSAPRRLRPSRGRRRRRGPEGANQVYWFGANPTGSSPRHPEVRA